MKYFTNCRTLEQLKQEYKRLAKIHHPDCGGDEETMKAINNDYDRMFEVLKDIHNADEGNAKTEERPEDFRNIIDALMKMNGLVIEICGSWVWISGDTYPHRNALKALGFKWANAKKKWYLGESSSNRRGSMSMSKIRQKYGSEIFVTEPIAQIA